MRNAIDGNQTGAMDGASGTSVTEIDLGGGGAVSAAGSTVEATTQIDIGDCWAVECERIGATQVDCGGVLVVVDHGGGFCGEVNLDWRSRSNDLNLHGRS